tara:strand:+ start:382 stop:660 length:279 start_codon:yes stop_codon:yes gene_type:complete
MSRKNLWVKDAEELLKEQALSSTELSYKLKDKHRYNPHARKITLVLRGMKSTFVELNKVSIDSSLRRESHQVSLWGLRNTEYEMNYPYRAIK